MAVETDEDRLAFFDDGDFGVAATITPSAGSPRTVTGILYSPSLVRGLKQSNQYNGTAPVSGQETHFRARASDLAGITAGGAQIEVNGVLYDVWDNKPDGTGMASLELKRA